MTRLFRREFLKRLWEALLALPALTDLIKDWLPPKPIRGVSKADGVVEMRVNFRASGFGASGPGVLPS